MVYRNHTSPQGLEKESSLNLCQLRPRLPVTLLITHTQPNTHLPFPAKAKQQLLRHSFFINLQLHICASYLLTQLIRSTHFISEIPLLSFAPVVSLEISVLLLSGNKPSIGSVSWGIVALTVVTVV